MRDWLYVVDHARAIDTIFHKAKDGSTYNVGGHNEWTNINVIRLLCRIMDKKLNRPEGTSEKLITFVKDRAGHDLRYALDFTKIRTELGYEPQIDLATGLAETIAWYRANPGWWTPLKERAQLP